MVWRRLVWKNLSLSFDHLFEPVSNKLHKGLTLATLIPNKYVIAFVGICVNLTCDDLLKFLRHWREAWMFLGLAIRESIIKSHWQSVNYRKRKCTRKAKLKLAMHQLIVSNEKYSYSTTKFAFLSAIFSFTKICRYCNQPIKFNSFPCIDFLYITNHNTSLYININIKELSNVGHMIFW